jgi:plasmid stabilization system protein ParE
MTYRVLVTEKAQQDLESACAWWAQNRSHEQAQRWYAGFAAAIRSLAQEPERHPRAQESESSALELRQLHYGLGRRRTHRAVFVVRENMVVVLRVRHLAQDQIAPGDI